MLETPAPAPAATSAQVDKPTAVSAVVPVQPQHTGVDTSSDSPRAHRARPRPNYTTWPSEDEDELSEDEQPVKRQRLVVTRRDQQPEDEQLAAETAWAVGLSGVAVTEEEEELLPAGTEEQAYVKARNTVLTRWRADVSRYLSEDEALAAFAPKDRPLAALAWAFLNTFGYINFGVAPALIARGNAPATKQQTVIVVGAGLAGLGAARQLRGLGYSVIVLEGRDRAGGRVYTKKLEAHGVSAVADLGGSIVTGIDGNPLAVLCKQLGIPMYHINGDDAPLYMPDGREADKELDSKVHQQFNGLLDAASRHRDDLGEVADLLSLGVSLETVFRDALDEEEEQEQQGAGVEPADVAGQLLEQDKAPQGGNGSGSSAGSVSTTGAAAYADGAEQTAGQRHDRQQQQQQQRLRRLQHRQLFDWHMANVEFANAAGAESLSLRNWDQDDPHELLGAHIFVPGGNLRLVSALAQDLPICYNCIVQRVSYSQTGVVVETEDAVFRGDAVLVTVPLGVLKRERIVFDPPLPQRKMDAIHRMGFGLLNKVALLFPHVFWDAKDMFGQVVEERSRRGEYYLFYSYAHISGGAMLVALVAGEAAVSFEQQSAQESVQRVMAILRRIGEQRGVAVPPPLQASCTRWGADPMSCGSYSSVAVGSYGADDYDTIAEHVGGRLFFGGEATIRKYPATMHGAYMSGLRQAANIAGNLQRLATSTGSGGANGSSRAGLGGSRRRGRAAGVARVLAGARAGSDSVDGTDEDEDRFVEMVEPDVASLKNVQDLTAEAKLLQQVFDVCEPDVEFGAISAIFGPAGSALREQALVQLQLGGLRQGPKPSTHIYLAVHRAHLELLRDMPGGDDVRLAVLSSQLALSLLGRGGLSDGARELLLAIAKDKAISVPSIA